LSNVTKLQCNLATLRKTPQDSKVQWNLAAEALGKGRPSLPASLKKEDGSNTCGDQEAATTMNEFYIRKVAKLREKNEGNVQSTTDSWPRQRRTFEWTYVSAAKVAKEIRQLNPTEALGTDGIPVSVLKKGLEVLALPLAHLVNMSYATGTVPDIFKNAKVHPVHKGGGKSRTEPSSYRPVSILPVMSKILEGLVKKDLERRLVAVNGQPQSQHGLRPGRSCTMALASAHVKWT
jgi:hypothetical protein